MAATAGRVAYRLTPAQLAYRRSEAPYRGLAGGIGSGKSWVGALDLLLRARPGRLYMAVGPTYVMLRDASLRSFLAHAEALRYLREFRRADMAAVLGNGAEVVFRTSEDPDRLRGPNLSGVWLDEASLMAREAFDVAIGRLREGGVQGWLGATFTPRGRGHWTYRAFAAGGPDAAFFRCRTQDNPFLPPSFAETVARQYGDALARQELGGEFLEDEAGHLVPDAWLAHAARLGAALRGKERRAEAVGVDPGEGVSKTALAAVDRLGVIEVQSLATPDTSAIGPAVLAFARRHGVPAQQVALDRGGGGKQIADLLRSQGHEVRTVAFGEALSLEPRRLGYAARERLDVRESRHAYSNRRAQMYGQLRELFDPSGPGGGWAVPPGSEALLAQLAPIPLTYDREGRLTLLPKNRRPGSKERCLTDLIGHSPDEADAVALAAHAMLHPQQRRVLRVF